MKKTSLLQSLVCIAFAITLVGCAQFKVVEIGPQSHFDFPNSNVTPLGPVKVKTAGGSGFMVPPLKTSEDDLKLYNEAIAQSNGATMIIDYVRTYTVYGFLFVYWSEMEIEGTAAKMEVGKHDLK